HPGDWILFLFQICREGIWRGPKQGNARYSHGGWSGLCRPALVEGVFDPVFEYRWTGADIRGNRRGDVGTGGLYLDRSGILDRRWRARLFFRNAFVAE